MGGNLDVLLMVEAAYINYHDYSVRLMVLSKSRCVKCELTLFEDKSKNMMIVQFDTSKRCRSIHSILNRA